jgi:hypothetical protein
MSEEGPRTSLVMDNSGNLYGANFGDGAYGVGSRFKLSFDGGVWNYAVLHECAGGPDGAYPYGPLATDAREITP